MPSRVFQRLPLVASALAGLALVLGLGACGDDDPTACDPYEVGVIEGRVTSAGEPLAVAVGADPLDRDNPLSREIWTTADSTGWYRLELPTGSYQMQVEDPASPSGTFDRGDTVRVGPEVRRHDIARGHAAFRFVFPPDFEGERFNLDLQAPGRGRKSMRSEVSDGVLTFTFLTLGPDDYWMQLDAELTGRFYLPGVRDRVDAETLTVGTRDLVRVERDFRPGAAAISGTITGAWQEAGGYLSVAAAGDRPSTMGRIYCADDGSFTLPILFPQPIRLMVGGSGYSRWIGGTDYFTAQVFDLAPGAPIEGIELRDSGMHVRLQGPGDQVSFQPSVLLRDENGHERTFIPGFRETFDLYNLDAGRYYLQISGNCESESWAPQWYGGAEDFAGAVPIDLLAGERRDLVFDLVTGGRIEGGILVPAGGLNPVRYYALHKPDGDTVCDYGEWSDGRMHFQGLPDGSFYVTAGIAFEMDWFYPGTWDIAEAVPITITDHGTVTDIVWPLPDIVPGDNR
jgi:hypothetical protein